MQRFKITIEYDGTDFVGWQAQENGASIQEALESAIQAFSGETIRVQGAGRTDAGVHALGQVAHFDLEKPVRADQVQGALNHHLKPSPVVILTAEKMDQDFHARFSAQRRHYIYRIKNRRAPLALDKNRVWRVASSLDADAMHRAAQSLVGKHDFTTFRSVHCQAKSPVKTLDRLEVTREGDDITVTVEAKSFLHHQVRSMVGCLKLVGEGKWRAADLRTALDAKDRAALGLNAPPEGLYLSHIDY